MKSWKSYKLRSGTKSIRNDVSKGNMIFNEESSRALCEMGARTRGVEHVSMRRLALTQSKYDGPNQNSFCSVENSILPCLSNHIKRKEKWTQPMADGSSKSHGCKKRSDETRRIHLFFGPMAERRSIPSFSIGTRLDRRVGQVDCISKIDIRHDAPYQQRLRNGSTIHMRSVDSNKQAGPLC